MGHLMQKPSSNSPVLIMSCDTSCFTIIRELPRGGFGLTYLAHRNSNDTEVCLKEIPLTNGPSQQQIEREAKILSELSNEHVIKYYASFAESGNFYIVMEYAEKGSLADLITV